MKERLEELVRAAPRGTLIPVEGLAELIDGTDDAGDLAVDDVGRLAAERFGRNSAYTPAAIRKWIRSGLRGVRLPAYPFGRGYRVRQTDFDRFVADVRGQTQNRPPRRKHATVDEFDQFADDLHAGRAYAASAR